MSKARKSFIYSQIEAALAELLSTEEIEEALAPIFDQVAIATIRADDILAQAQRLAMPMDELGVLDILNALESHLSQEDSLSLDAVNDQVQAWFDGMDWEEIPSERMKSLQGDFLLAYSLPHADVPEYKHASNTSYWLALRMAHRLAQEIKQPVEILSIDPNLDPGDLETLVACSHCLRWVEAEG